MRKVIVPFGAILPLLTALPLAAQDVSPPANAPLPPPPSVPAAEMPPPTMTAKQNAQFGSWTAERQAIYDAWPGDVQTYFWTLPEPRQDMFWRLNDNDRGALTSMPPESRQQAWELVERRLTQQSEAPKPPTSPEPPQEPR